MRLLPLLVALVLCGAAHAQSATELLLFGGNCNQASVSAGLVGRWLACDGASVAGAVARDLSGFGNNLTLNGSPLPPPVSAQVGYGMSFNGTNQYLSGSATTVSSQAFPKLSICSLVTLASTSGAQHIVGRTDGSIAYQTAGGFGLDFGQASAGKFGFHFNNGTDNRFAITFSPSAGVTYLVCGTFNSTTGTATGYVNTASANNTNSSTFSTVAIPTLSVGFRIARWDGGANPFWFGGTLNNTLVYAGELSSPQISQMTAAVFSGRASNDNIRGLEVLDRGLIAANDDHPLLDQLLTPMRRRPL